MKSELTRYKAKCIKFPILMETENEVGDKIIVFFRSPTHGVIVYDEYGDDPDSTPGVGYFSETWDMGEFREYHGKVTLSNGED